MTPAERLLFAKNECQPVHVPPKLEWHAPLALAARRVWENSEEIDKHPYFLETGVRNYGLRAPSLFAFEFTGQDGVIQSRSTTDAFFVPIKTFDESIVSIQAHYREKGKKIWDTVFIGGGMRTAGWFSLGEPDEVKSCATFVVCPDYETAAAIHQAAGFVTVVAFEVSNVAAVARAFQTRYPDCKIVLAGPRHQKGSTYEQTKALLKSDGWSGEFGVVRPNFEGFDPKGQSFNDLRLCAGVEQVRQQFNRALAVDAPLVIPETCESCPSPSADLTDSDQTELAADPTAPSPPFDVLGHADDKIFVYVREGGCIKCRGFADWSENALTAIAPRSWWTEQFGTDRKFNRQDAVDWLQRKAYAKGPYTSGICRGRGAWRDVDRTVYNAGEILDVAGATHDLTSFDSHFAYARAQRLPLPAQEPMSDAEGVQLLTMAGKFNWSHPASSALLVGWIALAPLAGSLRWRPHSWITGPAGSGKSTLLRDFVAPLLNGAFLFAHGSSTEAGIRRALGVDAIAVLFDETEQNNSREEMRVQQILSLMRQSSTETGAQIYRGGFRGEQTYIRSMFMLSSTSAGVRHPADSERIVELPICQNEIKSADSWNKLQAELRTLQDGSDLPARLLRRSLDLLPVTLQNIEIFSDVSGEVFESHRKGDQIGTLLAGTWSLTSGSVVSREQAKQFLGTCDWSHLRSLGDDIPNALSEILNAKIKAKSEDRSVRELVSAILECPSQRKLIVSKEEAVTLLIRHGLKVFPQSHKRFLAVDCEAEGLRKLLKNSNPRFGIGKALQLIPGVGASRPEHMGNGTVRIMPVPFEAFLQMPSDESKRAPQCV